MSHSSNSHLGNPANDKIKSPAGIFGTQQEEQTPYEIIKADNGIEIRSYKPQALACITLKGDWQEAQKEAFNALAGYIFGENHRNEKIHMTTPVLTEEKENKNFEKIWTMSFILPAEFLKTNAPIPKDKRISLHERQTHLIASLSYPGMSNEEKIAEYKTVLWNWLLKRPWYVPVGEFQMAQFDGPLTIPFFRKNEIHIEVKQLQ